jgi:hypothetical protein
MMYRARFSIDFSCFDWIRFPQKTWKLEYRHVESIEIISLEIPPLVSSLQKTLCLTMASSFFRFRGGATLG